MTTTPLDSLPEEYYSLIEEYEYTSKTLRYSENFHEGMGRFTQLAAMIPKNPALLLDASFKEIVFEALDSSYDNLREIVNIVAPKSFQEYYDYAMYLFLEFGYARSLMKSGINNIDIDDLNAADSHLRNCIHYKDLIAKFEVDMINKLREQKKDTGKLSERL